MTWLRTLLLVLLSVASTQTLAWVPDRPITVTIGYAAGSQNEMAFTRAAEIVKQNNPGIAFVLAIRPGVDGVLANNHLVTQPADGLTVGVPSIAATVVANDRWYSNVKHYNWVACSIPVVLGETHLALIANPRSKINTLSDFLFLLKTTRQPINIATSGGSQSLAFADLPTRDSNANEIKYRNSAEVAVAVAGNQTEFGITAVGSVMELVKAKQLKIITTSEKQNPNFRVTNGFMLMLPPGTSSDIVEWYEQEFGRAIQDPRYQQWAQLNNISVNTELRHNAYNRQYLYAYQRKFSGK